MQYKDFRLFVRISEILENFVNLMDFVFQEYRFITACSCFILLKFLYLLSPFKGWVYRFFFIYVLILTVLAGDQSWPFFITFLYLVTETLCLVILRV